MPPTLKMVDPRNAIFRKRAADPPAVGSATTDTSLDRNAAPSAPEGSVDHRLLHEDGSPRNILAEDAAETARINREARFHVPNGLFNNHPVSVQTDPGAASDMGVEAGEQTKVEHEQLSNAASAGALNVADPAHRDTNEHVDKPGS